MKTKTDRYGCNFLKSLRRIGIKENPAILDQCPDALSATPLGEWRDDGLDIVPLQLNSDNSKVAELQLIKDIKQIPKIILILESPHKDEFRKNKCNVDKSCDRYRVAVPAPARGVSGRNIKQYLPNILKIFPPYYVAIINPIQYQCSLGKALNGTQNKQNKIQKDKIFCDLLAGVKDKSFPNSFVRRITEIYNSVTDIIMISCTAGTMDIEYRNSNEVYKIVKSLVRNEYANKHYPILLMHHPSSWHNCCASRKISILSNDINDVNEVATYFCGKNYPSFHNRLNKEQPDGTSTIRIA